MSEMDNAWIIGAPSHYAYLLALPNVLLRRKASDGSTNFLRCVVECCHAGYRLIVGYRAGDLYVSTSSAKLVRIPIFVRSDRGPDFGIRLPGVPAGDIPRHCRGNNVEGLETHPWAKVLLLGFGIFRGRFHRTDLALPVHGIRS